MWMSKSIGVIPAYESPEKGRVTLSQNGIEAGATVTRRDVDCVAPYGYQGAPPVDEEVMLLPSNEGVVVAGALTKVNNVKSGEVRISSQGGATILLRNDGCIELNGMVIDRKGVIRNDR